MDLDRLKHLLSAECHYQLADDVMDRFLSGGERLSLKTGEVLIHAGQFDPNIYIVMSGVVRHTFMNGEAEKTATFALAPTMFTEYHCFYAREESFYQVEACCRSEVLKIPKTHYDRMVAESHEFARWALSMADNQFYYYERKNSVINGDAKERFESLIKNRPEIIDNVQLKVIASYLGITQQYLIKLKNGKKNED